MIKLTFAAELHRVWHAVLRELLYVFFECKDILTYSECVDMLYYRWRLIEIC
jgi:hypothetical protein